MKPTLQNAERGLRVLNKNFKAKHMCVNKLASKRTLKLKGIHISKIRLISEKSTAESG